MEFEVEPMVGKAQEIVGSVVGTVIEILEYAKKGFFLLIGPKKKKVKKVAKVARFKPIHPSEVATVPEAYVKQIGVLKAENAILKEKISKLKKEKELLEGKRRQELLQLIEARRDAIARLKYGEYIKLDFPSLRDKNIVVLSKDLKRLGYFYTFLVGNGEIAVVVSEYPKGKGRKFIVMRGPDLDSIFDFAENLADQVKSGVMILNRMYDGGYVPPIRIPFTKVPVIALKNAFVCAYCNKRFNTEKELIDHLRREHTKLLFGDGEVTSHA